jgi:hypothetical protein
MPTIINLRLYLALMSASRVMILILIVRKQEAVSVASNVETASLLS